MKDLTISNIERQNVLNNRFAVSKVQEHLDIEGMLFEGEYRFTKKKWLPTFIKLTHLQ